MIGSPETIRARIAAHEAAGVQELVLRFVNGTDLEALRRFAREFIAKRTSCSANDAEYKATDAHKRTS